MVSELSMLPTELLRYCKEIAMGMSYLACKGYIHKNLMARNVLLDKHKVCKVQCLHMTENMNPNVSTVYLQL